MLFYYLLFTNVDSLRLLWNGQSGLCTSFTIQVAIEAKMADIQNGTQKRTRKKKLINLHVAGWEISGTSAEENTVRHT